jgi:hypothetical protein
VVLIPNIDNLLTFSEASRVETVNFVRNILGSVGLLKQSVSCHKKSLFGNVYHHITNEVYPLQTDTAFSQFLWCLS